MADKFWWKGPDGSMKLVDMAEFQKAMRELRSSAETPPPGPGLGDVVAGATKAVGIKPCGKCQKRRQAMNKATPRYARRLLGWLEISRSRSESEAQGPCRPIVCIWRQSRRKDRTMGEIVQVSQSGPISPLERVKRNEEAVTAVAAVVKRNYIKKIGDKGYLMVAGAQAVGSSLGYTTAVESIRYVPPTEHLPGYWEAVAVVFDHGVAVGRGMGGVFDDERQWAKRDHFARQMMAQTRATGRALKGVMGWATALLGAEGSLAEEMPAEGPRMPQDASEVITRVPSLPSPPKGSKGQEGGLRRVRAVLAAVQAKESKAGKPYWRVGLEAADGVTDWFTSFDEVSVTPGVMVEVTLKPYKDGELVSDVVAVPVGEEVPF